MQNILVGHPLASEKDQLPSLGQVCTLGAHSTHSPICLAFEGIFSFVTLTRHFSEAELTSFPSFGTCKIHTHSHAHTQHTTHTHTHTPFSQESFSLWAAAQKVWAGHNTNSWMPTGASFAADGHIPLLQSHGQEAQNLSDMTWFPKSLQRTATELSGISFKPGAVTRSSDSDPRNCCQC